MNYELERWVTICWLIQQVMENDNDIQEESMNEYCRVLPSIHGLHPYRVEYTHRNLKSKIDNKCNGNKCS